MRGRIGGHRRLWVLFLGTCLFAGSEPVFAEVYRVGAGQRYSKVSEIAGILVPGDTVELSSDIEDVFTISASGLEGRPITLRGVTRVENGAIVRPRITAGSSAPDGIRLAGDWCVFEGFDVTRGPGVRGWGYALAVLGSNVLIRNSRFHHNVQGVGSVGLCDNLKIEFCEFDSNGSGTGQHSLYVTSVKPEARVSVEFCYFHDATGGVLLDSRFPRSVIRYNWFENAYRQTVHIVCDEREAPPPETPSELRPMHSDIVGNVFIQGHAPGGRYCVLSLGGESSQAPGTEGDFSVAHNLFVITRSEMEMSSRAVAMLVHGNVDRLRAFNNLVVEYGVAGCSLYQRGEVWDIIDTKRFIAARGSADPIVEGAGNCVSLKTTDIPAGLSRTVYAANPKLQDLLNLDLRPRRDSLLVGAGEWPLPIGHMVDLAPEYEPQRGIPVDLKPLQRRKQAPPSIGPFEVSE